MHPFLPVLFTLLALDAIWLWVRAAFHDRFFYAVQQAPLVVRWIPAALVYLILAAALTWGVLRRTETVREAVVSGAIVGGTLYGFYDLTNMATLARWTWNMTIVDTLWGALASAAAAGVAAALR